MVLVLIQDKVCAEMAADMGLSMQLILSPEYVH